jgi:NAD(P)-dependent dehydrogenase (short-subunit alcohol dehydrogenase family)
MKSSRVVRRMARTGLDAMKDVAMEESQTYRSARRAMKGLKWLAIGGATAGITAGVAAGLGVGLAGYAVARKLRTAVELNGKVVLITGSSRGLGLAMAQEFAKRGCKLVICARDERELQVATEELARAGATVLGVPCDLGDRQQVERMIEQATLKFGGIDVLVNNAGIITVGPLESQTLEDFEDAMRVMFWGTVYPTLAVLPQMIARRSGSIANITSIGGKVSVPHLLPYSCAKFAAVAFSEGLRAELGRFGLKVTTVVPGLMRTGSHVNAYFKGNNQAEYG